MTNDSMQTVMKLTSQRNVHWGQAPPESADEPRMAEVCQGQRDTSAILMRADKALYDARRTGRGNRFWHLIIYKSAEEKIAGYFS